MYTVGLLLQQFYNNFKDLSQSKTEQNRTEQNLLKMCTKYIVFFIYNITNIVMSCDKYPETEMTDTYKSTCEIGNMCEDEQKGSYYLWTLRVLFGIARASLTNIDNLTSSTLLHEFK